MHTLMPTTDRSKWPDYEALSKRKKLFNDWIEDYLQTAGGEANLVNDPIRLLNDFRSYEAEVYAAVSAAILEEV